MLIYLGSVGNSKVTCYSPELYQKELCKLTPARRPRWEPPCRQGSPTPATRRVCGGHFVTGLMLTPNQAFIFLIPRSLQGLWLPAAPRLKPLSSISVPTDTTGFHARLREGPNADRRSLSGSRSKSEGAVPHRDPPRPALPCRGRCRGAREGSPPHISDPGHGAHARTHSAAGGGVRSPRPAGSKRGLLARTHSRRLRLPSCNAQHPRLGSVGDEAHLAVRAGCWVSLFSKQLRQRRGVALGVGSRPVAASFRARSPC